MLAMYQGRSPDAVTYVVQFYAGQFLVVSLKALKITMLRLSPGLNWLAWTMFAKLEAKGRWHASPRHSAEAFMSEAMGRSRGKRYPRAWAKGSTHGA